MTIAVGLIRDTAQKPLRGTIAAPDRTGRTLAAA
jgi:hypothetical protein